MVFRYCRWTRAIDISPRRGRALPRIPDYFDPENIVKLSRFEGGRNAVASTFGRAWFAVCPQKYAHKIPFLVKLNHNELLTYPNKFSTKSCSGQSKERAEHGGGHAVGATI